VHTASRKINVLLADDSGFMRLILSDILGSDGSIGVVGTAVNGQEAYEKTRTLKPDVVLLDLVMPEYDGLYAVKQIMAHCPTPIVVLSALGNTNSEAVFEALDAGAYDFLSKPAGVLGSKLREIEEQLVAKIRHASAADLRTLERKKTHVNHNAHTFDGHLAYEIVVVGASTGGTGAIEEILQQLPSNFPLPIVIAQHMPVDFVELFARRLNDMLPVTVKVAKTGESPQPGIVYILPGDQNTTLTREGAKVRFGRTDQRYAEFNNPSADALLLSAASCFGARSMGILLTGMGKDGAAGMVALHRQGAFTIAQNEQSSVVFGMPRAAIERGAVRAVLPVKEIAGFVVSCLS
jgi:two-component system chemotaxis response regulator CheB